MEHNRGFYHFVKGHEFVYSITICINYHVLFELVPVYMYINWQPSENVKKSHCEQ